MKIGTVTKITCLGGEIKGNDDNQYVYFDKYSNNICVEIGDKVSFLTRAYKNKTDEAYNISLLNNLVGIIHKPGNPKLINNSPKYEYSEYLLEQLTEKEKSLLFSFSEKPKLPKVVTPQILLYHYVQFLLSNRIAEKFMTRRQAACSVYGKDTKKMDYIISMLDAYKNDFFEFQDRGLENSHFRPDIPQLLRFHPEIFGNKKSSLSFEYEMIEAIEDEIAKIKSNLRNDKNWLFVKGIELKSEKEGSFVYYCELQLEDDNQVINLVEDTKVIFKSSSHNFQITILEFDARFNSIFFSSNKRISDSNGRIESNCIFLLEALRDKILTNEIRDDAGYKSLFQNRFDLLPRSYDHTILADGLDDSQKNALDFSLKHNLAYIWGPPGTGKSHTLSTLLVNLLQSGEKTLVCTIANVAVDGLTSKFLDRIKESVSEKKITDFVDGEVLRVGFVKDETIIKSDRLYPNSGIIKQLRSELDKLYKEKKKFNNEEKEREEYAFVINKISQLLAQLESETKRIIENAKIVFSTSSKAIIDKSLSEQEFDNLIIDEGSMMAIPNLYALIAKVKKRVIISGDFRQLGPISMARTAMAEKWLQNDLFSLLGSDLRKMKQSKCLCMLNNQRRCAPAIINLVNDRYYQGELITLASDSHFVAFSPAETKPNHIDFVDMYRMPDYKFLYTSAGSRINNASIKEIKQIVCKINEENTNIKTVGIISPYRAQVNKMKKEIALLKEDYTFNFDIREGTIHTFQGSECDVIIFDMVDSLECDQKKDKKQNQVTVGSIYQGVNGEKLVNVAISRAKSKLIVVGCSRVLSEANRSELVTTSVKSIIAEIKRQSL